MKKLLIFIGLLLFLFFFPLKFSSLPESWTLQTKEWVSSYIQHNDVSARPTSGYINKIHIGMNRKDVEAITGEKRTEVLNQYGEKWTIYHDQYRHFTLVNYSENKVTGIFSMADRFKADGIKSQDNYQTVKKQLGQPLKFIESEDYRLKLNEKHSLIYYKNNQYKTYYFDQYAQNRLVAVKIVTKSLENQKKRLYANPSDKLAVDYERLEFYLTNADRVKYGLTPLRYHKKISHTAKKHAEDMAEHHYFSHTNQRKMSPFDRMTADGLDYYTAGENLAFGQISPIEAHHGLMNSKGHRENILNNNYEQLGIGVAFSRENVPYYTENYITER